MDNNYIITTYNVIVWTYGGLRGKQYGRKYYLSENAAVNAANKAMQNKKYHTVTIWRRTWAKNCPSTYNSTDTLRQIWHFDENGAFMTA